MEIKNDLNKALSELYSDLENLQSAREQVEIVTSSSKGLTKSTSTLLQELREFSNQFGETNTSNISQLTQSLEQFENRINSISDKGNESILDYIETFKSLEQAIFFVKRTGGHKSYKVPCRSLNYRIMTTQNITGLCFKWYFNFAMVGGVPGYKYLNDTMDRF